jgi:hypothetical protein
MAIDLVDYTSNLSVGTALSIIYREVLELLRPGTTIQALLLRDSGEGLTWGRSTLPFW